DPRSQRQPDGPHGFSQVVDLDGYGWGSADWTGRILPGGLIYEMHVGTYAESGDFEGVEKRLDHLVDLGVTHVELMPVQPFGGDRNWGYDGVSWHAVHEGYGGDRKSTRLNSSHVSISYAVFCLKKKSRKSTWRKRGYAARVVTAKTTGTTNNL